MCHCLAVGVWRFGVKRKRDGGKPVVVSVRVNLWDLSGHQEFVKFVMNSTNSFYGFEKRIVRLWLREENNSLPSEIELDVSSFYF